MSASWVNLWSFFNEILEGIAANKYGTLRDLMEIKADLEGLWKA